MSIHGAINEIAEAQGGTPSTDGTIIGAIDALNDALAGSDQPAATTIEGAVRSLGEHIGGGGGSFGSLQSVAVEYDLPTVGGEVFGAAQIVSVGSGGTVYAEGNASAPVTALVASGLTAVSFASAEYTECDAYVCGVDENYEYTSVTPWDGTVTVGSMEQGGVTYNTFTITVPELDFDPETGTGEQLTLYVHEA